MEDKYYIKIYDDCFNLIFEQAIISYDYELVETHAEKLRLFFGFDTTYRIKEGKYETN